MHLLFDGQALQSPWSKNRGIGRYALSLLGALRLARPDWRIRVIETGHLPPVDRSRLPDGLEFERLELPMLPYDARVNRWLNDRAYGDWLADQPADAFLSAHSFEFEGIHPLYGERRPPTIVVLYDLIPQRFDDVYLIDGIFRDFYTDRLRQTCESDMLLAISRWTARDYQELQPAGPARVTAIGGAPDPQFQPLSADRLQQIEANVRARFGLAGQFILNPSGQCWRKNSRGALMAYADLPAPLRAKYEFVVACRMNRAEENDLHRLADQLGVSGSLRVTGFIEDDELRALYQLCRVCIFPSFYEGLGLPIVEALQCGAPVVTSDCSSLPEYAGPHSFLCDPTDNAALTEALEAALREPRQSREAERVAFARQFCWEDVAERAARAVEEELARQQQSRLVPRPRLAWVTTAIPGSREMERVEQLVGALAQRFAVEYVVPDEHPGMSAASNCQVPMIRAADLRERHRVCPFKHFLYDGSSASALPFLTRLARHYPGLLLDDAGDDEILPTRLTAAWTDSGAPDGFLARAVSTPQRWAALRARVSGPLYLIDSQTVDESPFGDRPASVSFISGDGAPTPSVRIRLNESELDLLPSGVNADANESNKTHLSATTIAAACLAVALESLDQEPVVRRMQAA